MKCLKSKKRVYVGIKREEMVMSVFSMCLFLGFEDCFFVASRGGVGVLEFCCEAYKETNNAYFGCACFFCGAFFGVL